MIRAEFDAGRAEVIDCIRDEAAEAMAGDDASYAYKLTLLIAKIRHMEIIEGIDSLTVEGPGDPVVEDELPPERERSDEDDALVLGAKVRRMGLVGS